MKTNITLLMFSFLIASTASAYGKVRYNWPSVGSLAVNNACATETHFKSLRKLESCVETVAVSRQACQIRGEGEVCRPLTSNEIPTAQEDLREIRKCIKTESHDVFVPRTSQVKQCVSWTAVDSAGDRQCLKYETVTKVIGKSFKVEMFSLEVDSEERFEGYLDFTIPDCK